MRYVALSALIVVGCGAGPDAIGEPGSKSAPPSDAGAEPDASLGVPPDAAADATEPQRTYPPWTRQFGGAEMDAATALAVDGSGNVYVAGYADFVGFNVGTTDAFVRKYDPTGALVWDEQFGSTKDDLAYAIAVDASAGVYVAGVTYGSLTGEANAGVAAFVRKYDAAGGTVWTRQLGNGGVVTAQSVTVDASGNVYVAGTTSSTLPAQTSAGFDDAYVRKYDPRGTPVWTRQFGSSGFDHCSEVGIDGSGDVYVTGIAGKALPGQTSAGGGYVQTYDVQGNFVSTLQFGNMNAGGVEVHRDGSGTLFVTGTINGALPGQTSAGLLDAFVQKFDSGGTLLWGDQFGGSDDDTAHAVVVDASGSVFVAGHASGSAFVRKYDASGTLDPGLVDTDSATEARAIALDGTGGLYIAGSTYGALTGQTSAGSTDAFVMHLVP
jgi:hypothetical protein